jgi:hypothetical protein
MVQKFHLGDTRGYFFWLLVSSSALLSDAPSSASGHGVRPRGFSGCPLGPRCVLACSINGHFAGILLAQRSPHFSSFGAHPVWGGGGTPAVA